MTRVDLDQVESISRRCIVQSVYVGSRSSDRFLNVYDKDAERAQVLGKPIVLGTYGIRWELRLRDERATAQLGKLRALNQDVDELLTAFWGAIASLVDFRQRDRRGGHHLEALERLDWFVQLAGDVVRQCSYCVRDPEADDWRFWRLHRWLTRCSASLAELQERSPHPLIIRELLADGADRLAARRARAAARIHAA